MSLEKLSSLKTIFFIKVFVKRLHDETNRSSSICERHLLRYLVSANRDDMINPGKNPKDTEALLFSIYLRMGSSSSTKLFGKHRWGQKTPTHHTGVRQNVIKKQSSKEDLCKLFSLATTLLTSSKYNVNMVLTAKRVLLSTALCLILA